MNDSPPAGLTEEQLDAIRQHDAEYANPLPDRLNHHVNGLAVRDRRALLAHIDSLRAPAQEGRADVLALIEGLRNDFINIVVGGCTCGTKPPDPELHELSCHYRMAEMGLARIEKFRAISLLQGPAGGGIAPEAVERAVRRTIRTHVLKECDRSEQSVPLTPALREAMKVSLRSYGALRCLLQAHERYVRSHCNTPKELADEPWRCMEYEQAARCAKELERHAAELDRAAQGEGG